MEWRWEEKQEGARRSPERLTSPRIASETAVSCFVRLGWGCWLGRAWEAVCVSNLTDLPLSLLIERALFICFDTSAFSVLFQLMAS